MSLLPTDDKQRKALPIYKLVTAYFPKALREVTKVAVANNCRFNDDSDPLDIKWNRDKSKDQLGSGFRHMLEYSVDKQPFMPIPTEAKTFCSSVGINRLYTLAGAAWRVLAALEEEIETQEKPMLLTCGWLDIPIRYGSDAWNSPPKEVLRKEIARLNGALAAERKTHEETVKALKNANDKVQMKDFEITALQHHNAQLKHTLWGYKPY